MEVNISCICKVFSMTFIHIYCISWKCLIHLLNNSELTDLWIGLQSVLSDTASQNKISVFWDIMLCSLLEVNWHFRGTCRPHLQGRLYSITSQNVNEQCQNYLYLK
jgi:hypothetical protein